MLSVQNREFEWSDTWALAVIFGLVSVPWTYGFVAELHIPLWPAFIGSATYFATEETGVTGLKKGYASNLSGILYAAITLLIVNTYLDGTIIALSIVVGIAMFVASLHAFVPALSFTPGGFFGYAAMFSVHATNATAFGITGVSGEAIAAIVSMLIGAGIGFTTEITSDRFS